jgi:putative peptide zinc metalloprotease protein
MFYYGMPAFFVDASDMWMAERRRGSWFLAGRPLNSAHQQLLAISSVLPPSTFRQVLFIAALVAYLNALLNLNPLLELDGYYVLIDLLQTGQLRQRSFDFVRKGFLPKVRNRAPFTREDVMYAIYGVLAIAFTALTVLFGIVIWKRELQTMVQHLAAGEDVLGSSWSPA